MVFNVSATCCLDGECLPVLVKEEVERGYPHPGGTRDLGLGRCGAGETVHAAGAGGEIEQGSRDDRVRESEDTEAEGVEEACV